MVSTMYRYRFLIATLVFTILLKLLGSIAAGFGGPSWLVQKEFGWIVVRSLVAVLLAAPLALVVTAAIRRKS